ncbi:MAG TPA: VWA domain-containing protein [Gemmatimonadaceae bacterium]
MASDTHTIRAPAPQTASDLLSHLVRFCRALREHGVPATPAEAIVAAEALARVELGDRDEVYLALRSVLTSRAEDYVVFDELFEAFWTSAATAGAPTARRPPTPRVALPDLAPPHRERVPVSLDRWMRAADDASEPAQLLAPSDDHARATQDFRTFGDDALREITRVAASMARRLAARPSRRWRRARRGSRVHLRATMRALLGTGGDAAELAYQERKLRKTKLVAICDVSGSMDLYSRFLLQFLYALQHSFARVETFVFSTRLDRITGQLEQRRYHDALDELSRTLRGWSGGTRIGESLAAFTDEWMRLVDRRTIVIILSDGWDTGDPEQLGAALEMIAKRAGRVIWLNPLLGSPAYQPLTRGMQAALPHVDVFAPAHNLASLEALVHHLSL